MTETERFMYALDRLFRNRYGENPLGEDIREQGEEFLEYVQDSWGCEAEAYERLADRYDYHPED